MCSDGGLRPDALGQVLFVPLPGIVVEARNEVRVDAFDVEPGGKRGQREAHRGLGRVGGDRGGQARGVESQLERFDELPAFVFRLWFDCEFGCSLELASHEAGAHLSLDELVERLRRVRLWVEVLVVVDG